MSIKYSSPENSPSSGSFVGISSKSQEQMSADNKDNDRMSSFFIIDTVNEAFLVPEVGIEPTRL